MKYTLASLLLTGTLVAQGLAFAQQLDPRPTNEWMDIQKIMRVIDRTNPRQLDQESADTFGNFMEWKDALFRASQPDATAAQQKKGITVPPKSNRNPY